MVPVFYLDTSVIGGYFDDEFRQATRTFWSQLLKGACRAMLSTLTLEELAQAPKEVRHLAEKLPETCYSVLEVTDEVQALADRYVVEGVVGQAYRTDAVHVAAATVGEVKAIISWNYKHLVNLRRIEEFNGVNLLMGYRPIDIRTPEEVIQP